jgi:hypothetical protein
VEFQLAVPQSGCGAPSAETQGCNGLTYLDEDTGKLYKCLSDDPGACRWEPADKDLEEQINDLERRLEEHINPYVNIAVIPSGLGTYERGVVIDSVNVKWSINRDPQSLTISGPGIVGTKTLSVKARNYTAPESSENKLGITWDNTNSFRWTITAKGEREEVSAKQTSPITFQNGIYWGIAVQPAAVNRDFLINVLGKQKKELTGTKNITVNVSGGDGLYFWYAYPARLKKSLFNIGGFDYEYNLTTFLFKNQHGYEEEYYVYRSGQYAPASLSVTVKDGG